MKYEKLIHDFLSVCDGRISNVFYELYSIVDSLDEAEQPAAVMYVCENAYRIESDYSYRIEKDYYTVPQAWKAEQKLTEKFIPAIKSEINACAKAGIEPIELYSRMWKLIQSSMFKSKRERALALFWLADYKLIPYRSVGIGLTMENDEYKATFDSFPKSLLDETRYILKMDYDQKTQRASLLVDRLLSLNSKEEQTVYMTAIMDEIGDNVKAAVTSALDNI